MSKAYLVIQVDAGGVHPTVVRAMITTMPAKELPGESVDRFWATVDECEGDTHLEALREMGGRLRSAARNISSFRFLERLVIQHDSPETRLSGVVKT